MDCTKNKAVLLGLLALAFSLAFSFAISFSAALSQGDVTISLSIDNMLAGTTQTQLVTIRNNNANESLNITLQSATSSPNITALLNETSFNLPASSFKTLSLVITSSPSAFGSYTVTLSGNASNGTTQISFSASDSFEVKYAYCDKNSTRRYLSIEIKNDDDFKGDTFKPYDVIDIEVKVKNNDADEHDVNVEAVLVDENGEEVDDSEVDQSITIDKDSSKTITLKLEIPVVDEGKYYVYVRAYDDDNELVCVQADSYIKVDRPSREIRIVGVTLDKESYNCGESMIVSGVVANIGTHDEDQVKVVYSDDMGNSIESIIYDLEEGEEKNFLFNINIPQNASQKQHSFNIKAQYDYSSGTYSRYTTYSGYFNIVSGCIVPVKDVAISISAPSTMELNTEYEGNILLSNTGDLASSYTLQLDATWAVVNLQTNSVSLNPGEQKAISFTIKPIEEGTKTLIARAKFDGKEKTASKVVSIEAPTPAANVTLTKASWWDEVRFEFARRPWALAIVIASLAVAVICIIGIILILSLLKRRPPYMVYYQPVKHVRNERLGKK
jgi:hypothetical protein